MFLKRPSVFWRNEGSKKVAIALSGGVDSSVAAWILRNHAIDDRNGCHELVGVHMSNWNTQDENDPYCTKERDWKDAQAVARHLKLPLYPTSFAAEYWTQVFEPFASGVEQGDRPNPDVHCNRHIKFGALKDYVQSTLKADILATGHYARLWNRSHGKLCPNYETIEEMLQEETSLDWIRSWGNLKSVEMPPLLLAARDRSKCQSFFLSSVPGRAFQSVVFPLGDLLKKKKKAGGQNTPFNGNNNDFTVREIAELASLPTAKKKDSMGICFIGKRPGGFSEFIDQYLPHERSGEYRFIDVNTGAIVSNEFGNSTSSHMVYTRGQRAKISGAAQAWFVVQTDRESRSIVVCQGTHHPALYTDTFYIENLHWVAEEVPSPLQQLAIPTVSLGSGTASMKAPVLLAKCRVRNLQPLVDCRVSFNDSRNKFQIFTEKPLRAITPGQHCAIYVGDAGLVCLGGGNIVERGPTYHDLGMDLELGDLHPAGHNDLSVVSS